MEAEEIVREVMEKFETCLKEKVIDFIMREYEKILNQKIKVEEEVIEKAEAKNEELFLRNDKHGNVLGNSRKPKSGRYEVTERLLPPP